MYGSLIVPEASFAFLLCLQCNADAVQVLGDYILIPNEYAAFDLPEASFILLYTILIQTFSYFSPIEVEKMQVRRFSPDMKTKVPGGHPGMYGVPIQIDRAEVPEKGMEELSQRLNGLPILLNRPMIVAALYLEAGGSMDEHGAEVPILFLVTRGKGFVRVGGTSGETRSVSAGDAVLWPAGLDHNVRKEGVCKFLLNCTR